MKNQIKHLVVALVLFSALNLQPSTARAQTTVFTYQGRVLDNGTNFNGNGQFKFALVTSTNFNHQAMVTANLSGPFVTSYNIISGGSGYASVPTVTVSGGGGSGATATAVITGGVVTQINPGSAGSGYTSTPTVTLSAPPANIAYTTYWSNDGSSSAGSEPAAAVGVGVTNGLFTVVLGDTTIANMTAISASLFSQPNLELRIWFNDGVNGSAALSPLQNLTPTPYAVFANTASSAVSATSATTASGVTTGAVNTVAIANNAVTGAKIAGGQVVKSLNGLEDAITLSAGNNVAITPSGQTLTIGEAVSGWSLTGNTGTTLGVNFVGTVDNQPLELHVNGARALRLEPDASGSGAPNVIGGSANNLVDPGVVGAFIGGGGAGNLGGSGYSNRISANFCMIGGGGSNTIQTNTTGGIGTGGSTICGGWNNTIQTNCAFSTIAGGAGNIIQTNCSGGSIGGGMQNTVTPNSYYGTVPGGVGCIAGNWAFAAGTHAKATNQGAFVWGDSWVKDFGSVNNNEFAIRATGGFRFVTGIDGSGNPTAGVTLGQGSSSWGTISDKNMKKDFMPVNCEEVLKKLARVPIEQWHYKWEAEASTPNIGPMAQDFKAAFYPGRDDKSITTLEFDGVELAAIKGLNQKLNDKDAEIQRLKQSVAELKAMVEKLAGK